MTEETEIKTIDTLITSLPYVDFSFFSLISFISSGKCGAVFKVKYKNKILCLKLLRDTFVKQQDLSNLKLTIEAIINLSHMNLIKSYCITKSGGGRLGFITKYYPYGNLKRYLKSFSFTTQDRIEFCNDLVRGLLFIHSNHLVHKNLKPENILVDTDFHLKICDFGLLSDSYRSQTFESSFDSPSYLAPEVFTNTFSYASDIFSLGLLFYEIFTNENLFYTLKNQDPNTFHQYSTGNTRFTLTSDIIPEDILIIIESCLSYNPMDRMTIYEIANCMHITTYVDEMDKVLKQSIIISDKYNAYFKNWLECKYKWRLVYRASEHDYTAHSFHQFCDNVGPTLILIKSNNGCIFGGYTSQSWKAQNGDTYKNDKDAFLFTLENLHSIPPTQFKKRSDSNCAIRCKSDAGPIFCGEHGSNIYIYDRCYRNKSCFTGNDGRGGFECDGEYNCSLFVNTNRRDEYNMFSVSELEVFSCE